jgi:hypothetical protein
MPDTDVDIDNSAEEELNSGNPRQNMVDLIYSGREEQIQDEVLEAGLSSLEEMHPETDQDQETEIPEEVKEDVDDSLAPFITMEEGEPMFKMLVDGEEVLMPLANVQRQGQLEASSRQRMEENARWAKNLAEREEQIQSQETALQTRLVTQERPLSQDVDDPDFVEEAQEIVSTLFEEDAEAASEKLAKTFRDMSTRAPVQAPINEEDIVKKTAAAVTKEQAEKAEAEALAAREADSQEGFRLFKEQYPELYKDPMKFGATDSKSKIIQEEHPDWMPSQIILEAGKQTQEWFDKLEQPSLIEDPEINDRQLQKEKLVPVPPSRTGSPEPAKEEEPQSKAEYLAEMRAARGQP